MLSWLDKIPDRLPIIKILHHGSRLMAPGHRLNLIAPSHPGPTVFPGWGSVHAGFMVLAQKYYCWPDAKEHG